MEKTSIISASLLALANPVAAGATPDDFISIRDEVFALGTDHVFVLRTSRDNLGVYYSQQIETHLVQIDVASGTETTWLVYRAREDTVFADEPADETLATIAQHREDWHDPFAIVADAGATVSLGMSASAYQPPAPANTVSDPDQYTITYDYGPVFAFSRQSATERAQLSLAAFSDRMYDAPRMTMATTREIFAERYVDWPACRLMPSGIPISYVNGRYQILRMDCHDGDDLEHTSLIQVVQRIG